MKTRSRSLFVAVVSAASMLPLATFGQWTPLLTHPLLQNPTTGATVGLAAGASALNVRGDQMTPATGFTFQTTSAGGTQNTWRMFRGLTQYGSLFAPTGANNNFVLSSTIGNLRFEAQGLLRMQLSKVLTTTTINGFTNLNTTGYLGISNRPAFFTGGPGPFSRIHLVDSVGINSANTYAQQYGYRPWMRNGITMTGNSDQAYFGQKYKGDDSTDVVFQWSDNPGMGSWTPDRMRFIFSSNYSASRDSGARCMEGLEAMRLYPVDSFNVNVGIGDFNKASVKLGSPVEPSERLDVVDKTIRLRSFTDAAAYRNDTYDRVVVANPTDGRLYWRPASTIGGGGGGGACTWSPGGNYDVYTAVGSGGSCPDIHRRVGIGVYAPILAKLHVVNDYDSTGTATGAFVDNRSSIGGIGIIATSRYTGGTTNYGVYSDINARGSAGNVAMQGWASGATGESTAQLQGVLGLADERDGSAQDVRGVYGYGIGHTSSNTGVYGVYGLANNDLDTMIHDIPMYGVYGKVQGTVSSNDYAGYFVGKAFCSGGVWSPSDENLKTNIEDLQGALDVVTHLHPKTFQYNTSVYPGMNFPHGVQAGLIAQDLTQSIPSLVSTAIQPASFDTSGVQLSPSVSFATIRMEGVIPYLIGAISELKVRNDSLQTRINNCCPLIGGGMAPGGNHAPVSTGTNSLQQERLMIIPNPFSDHTTLHYYVSQQGKVSLQVSGSDGRPLGTLREEQADAGEYTYEWNTQSLAAGMYYVSVVVDGKVVVMKGVKVEER